MKTINNILSVLNSALLADQYSFTSLINNRVAVNDTLANHKYITSGINRETEQKCIGLLGVINGIIASLCVENNETVDKVAACYDDKTGEIIKFCKLSELKE